MQTIAYSYNYLLAIGHLIRCIWVINDPETFFVHGFPESLIIRNVVGALSRMDEVIREFRLLLFVRKHIFGIS